MTVEEEMVGLRLRHATGIRFLTGPSKSLSLRAEGEAIQIAGAGKEWFIASRDDVVAIYRSIIASDAAPISG
jgi:hypothetical protein